MPTSASQEVSLIDVRGRVDTVDTEPGVQKSTYIAEYDSYLEGHIPVRIVRASCLGYTVRSAHAARLAHTVSLVAADIPLFQFVGLA
jgi:hypothetical protein